MEFYLLLLVTIIWSPSTARLCNLEYELPCLTSSDCIHKLQWCDQTYNCKDRSDENFCSVDSCPKSLFRCNNRKCVPDVAKCDGFDNCNDGSDEMCFAIETIREYPIPQELGVDGIIFYNATRDAAVTRAANYLIRRQTDNGWNSFTPRAVVALAFVARAGILPEKWLPLLRKEINIRIKIDLMRSNTAASLCDVAHYINALYATCQDPRHFHGIDLVKRLRTETNAVKKLDLPFVLLTLCIAREIDYQDIRRLMEMNITVGDSNLGSRALIVMAQACISHTQGLQRRFREGFASFESDTEAILGSFDIHTKALHVQAMNVLHAKTGIDLSMDQYPDGSFGDMLATYYAIPALLNSSLLDLKCKSTDYDDTSKAIEWTRQVLTLNVTYSLWIEKDTYIEAHSIVVPLKRGETFYDAMEKAGTKNSLFRFLYEGTDEGRKVYSLGDIPNDEEMGKIWSLYTGREDRVELYSKNYLTKRVAGVDRIFPAAGQHFIFWYERSSS